MAIKLLFQIKLGALIVMLASLLAVPISSMKSLPASPSIIPVMCPFQVNKNLSLADPPLRFSIPLNASPLMLPLSAPVMFHTVSILSPISVSVCELPVGFHRNLEFIEKSMVAPVIGSITDQVRTVAAVSTTDGRSVHQSKSVGTVATSEILNTRKIQNRCTGKAAAITACTKCSPDSDRSRYLHCRQWQ